MCTELPDQVRAAIATFLDACQKEARPFAISEALGAVRSVFPDLDISDRDLVKALTSEASAAGFNVDYDFPKSPNTSARRDNVEESGDCEESSSRADINPRN